MLSSYDQIVLWEINTEITESGKKYGGTYIDEACEHQAQNHLLFTKDEEVFVKIEPRSCLVRFMIPGNNNIYKKEVEIGEKLSSYLPTYKDFGEECINITDWSIDDRLCYDKSRLSRQEDYVISKDVDVYAIVSLWGMNVKFDMGKYGSYLKEGLPVGTKLSELEKELKIYPWADLPEDKMPGKWHKGSINGVELKGDYELCDGDVLYAEPISFLSTICIHVQDQSQDIEISVPYNHTVGECLNTIYRKMNSGLEIFGWYEDKDYKMPYNADTPVKSDKELYMKTQGSVSVTFHIVNSNNFDEDYKKVVIPYGGSIAEAKSKVSDKSFFERTGGGYTLIGWFTSTEFGKKYEESAILKVPNIDLYAYFIRSGYMFSEDNTTLAVVMYDEKNDKTLASDFIIEKRGSTISKESMLNNSVIASAIKDVGGNVKYVVNEVEVYNTKSNSFNKMGDNYVLNNGLEKIYIKVSPKVYTLNLYVKNYQTDGDNVKVLSIPDISYGTTLQELYNNNKFNDVIQINRTGYTLSKWFTNSDYTGSGFNLNYDLYKITSDTDLYAIFTIKTYDIKFTINNKDENNSSSTTIQNIKHGTNVYSDINIQDKLKSYLNKEGYNAYYWYTDSTCTQNLSNSSVVDGKFTTLYGYIEKKTFDVKVKYVYPDNASSIVYTVKAKYGTEYSEVKEKVLGDHNLSDKYVAGDFYDTESCAGNVIDLTSVVKKANTVYLKINYKPIEVELHIPYYNINNGVIKKTYNYGTKVNSIVSEVITDNIKNNIKTSGYIINGWYTDSSCNNAINETITISDTNKVFYARCEKYKFTVNIKVYKSGTSNVLVESGTVPNVEYGTKVKDISYTPQSPIADYILSKWYSNSSCGIKCGENDILKDTTTLYAIYILEEKPVYDVVFRIKDLTNFATVVAVEGTKFNEINNSQLVKELLEENGIESIKWYTSNLYSNEVSSNKAITNKLEVFGLPTYKKYSIKTLIYNGNSVEVSKTLDVVHGTKISEIISKLTNISKQGFEIDLWYTNSDWLNKYGEDEKITGAIDLYARYNRLSYVVTFKVGNNNQQLKIPYDAIVDDFITAEFISKLMNGGVGEVENWYVGENVINVATYHITKDVIITAKVKMTKVMINFVVNNYSDLENYSGKGEYDSGTEVKDITLPSNYAGRNESEYELRKWYKDSTFDQNSMYKDNDVIVDGMTLYGYYVKKNTTYVDTNNNSSRRGANSGSSSSSGGGGSASAPATQQQSATPQTQAQTATQKAEQKANQAMSQLSTEQQQVVTQNVQQDLQVAMANVELAQETKQVVENTAKAVVADMVSDMTKELAKTLGTNAKLDDKTTSQISQTAANTAVNVAKASEGMNVDQGVMQSATKAITQLGLELQGIISDLGTSALLKMNKEDGLVMSFASSIPKHTLLALTTNTSMSWDVMSQQQNLAMMINLNNQAVIKGVLNRATVLTGPADNSTLANRAGLTKDYYNLQTALNETVVKDYLGNFVIGFNKFNIDNIDKYYYMNDNGTIATGWIKDAAGNIYFFKPNGEAAVSKILYDNIEYNFDNTGKLISTNVDETKLIGLRDLSKTLKTFAKDMAQTYVTVMKPQI